MSTKALIIGKDKNGQYRYSQTDCDGYQNTEWLQKHMTNPDEVEEFLHKITEGGKNGKGCAPRCLSFSPNTDGIPRIKWYDSDYNSGIAKTKEEMISIITLNSDNDLDNFYRPEYLSYWNGKEWLGVGWDTLPGGFDANGWANNWKQFAPLVANN